MSHSPSGDLCSHVVGLLARRAKWRLVDRRTPVPSRHGEGAQVNFLEFYQTTSGLTFAPYQSEGGHWVDDFLGEEIDFFCILLIN